MSYKTKLIKIFLFLLFFSVFTAPVLADFNMTDWQYSANIINSTASAEGYASLMFPSEFFRNLKSDLSDLRIISAGEEIPYTIRVDRAAYELSRFSLRMFNLTSSTRDTSFIVDFGQSGLLHNAITIETNSENFRRMVEVEGSDDSANWRALTLQGQIYDYTVRDIKSVKTTDTRVQYPEASFRYLRVKILDNGESPIAVSGVSAYRLAKQSQQETTHEPKITILTNKDNQSTDIVADLGSEGIPHDTGEFTIASDNFSRTVSVSESSDGKNWNFRGNSYIFSINTAKFTGSRLKFSYPESRSRFLRVSIFNGDDKSLAISGLKLFGIARSVVFKYDFGREYTIYLGNPNARQPNYDIQKILSYVDASALQSVSASIIKENPDYRAPEPPLKPFTERVPFILPALLIFIVLILAGALFLTFKKVKRNEK